MSTQKPTFRRRIADAVRQFFALPPRVEKVYRTRFCNAIHARIILSNLQPTYALALTEPLQRINNEEFEAWRTACIAEFEKAHDAKISEYDFGNVRYLPFAELTKTKK